MTTEESTFEKPGSIEPPGKIGSIVRFVLGYFCLDLFIQIVDDIPGMIERGWPFNPVIIGSVILGFYLLKPLVNISFTVQLRYLPQILVGSLTLAVLLYQWGAGMPLFGQLFTAFLMFWMNYVFGHLGSSFLVAAIISAPGCEMRSLPHLWSKISGNASLEHYCPGTLTPIDNWERRLKEKN